LVPTRKCSGCGAIVTQRAIDTGRAHIDGDLIYCEDCAQLIRDPAAALETDEANMPVPDSASPTDATVELSVERLRNRLDKRRREKKEEQERKASIRHKTSGPTVVIITALIIGIVIAIIVLLRR
jgi:hypothetical protein